MGIASNPLAFHQLQCKILFAVHEPHPFVEASTTNSHGQHCECGHNVITWYWTLHPFGTPWKKARFQAFSWTQVRTNLHNCTPSCSCCCYKLLQMLRYFQDQLPFGSYWGDITCSWFWCPRLSKQICESLLADLLRSLSSVQCRRSCPISQPIARATLHIRPTSKENQTSQNIIATHKAKPKKKNTAINKSEEYRRIKSSNIIRKFKIAPPDRLYQF